MNFLFLRILSGILTAVVYLPTPASAFEILAATDTPQMVTATPEAPAVVPTQVNPTYDHTVYREFDASDSSTTPPVALPPSDPTKPVAVRLEGDVVRKQADLTNFATDPTLVASGADLEGFITPRIKADPRIVTVRAGGGAVEVIYATPATTLFGWIKSKMSVTARITSDGTIAVEQPWYGFLFSTDINPSRLTAQVAAYSNATSTTEFTGREGVLATTNDSPTIRMARNFLHLTDALRILSTESVK